MNSTLVVSRTGVVGGLVCDALARLGEDHTAVEMLPTGSLTERSEIWLDTISSDKPDVLFVNHLSIGRDGPDTYAAETAQAVLAAAARTDHLRRAVVVSSGEVYGAASDDPTFVAEDHEAARPHTRSTRVLLAAEQAAADLARARPDMSIVILRPAEVLGAEPHGVFAAHLLGAGRRVGAEAGFDPLVQFITDHDLAVVCLRAIRSSVSGFLNIAPIDAIAVSDAIELAGKSRVPTNRTATILGRFAGFGRPWSQELGRVLMFGRALDPARSGHVGWDVKASSAAALAGAFG